MVRLATESDIPEIAEMHSKAFLRQKNSAEWISCTLSSYPRFMCYVIEKDGKVIGYIFWSQKSGFRSKAVLELDQMAVLEKYRGQGYGNTLIKESLHQVKVSLFANAQEVEKVIVSTRADNSAQKLYKSALGAKQEALISNLYSADEVILVANVST